MIELSQQRSYNAKHFLHPTETGKKILQTFPTHIHYKEKETGEFKEVDFTLLWDEIKRGWGFKTHSFNPFFPEYSDGLVEFRDLFQSKDQTIKYRAICDKVLGERIENGIIYKDAFGKDKDYLLYNIAEALVKVGVINNPNEQIADVKFKWEIQLPDKDVYRAEKKEDVEKSIGDDVFEIEKDGKVLSYKLDITKAKTFDSAKQTLIGNSNLDGKEWFTYLKSFRAWDSNGNTIIVEARIFEENGKLYLEKTVPLSFLQKAVGKVFADTTTNYTATDAGTGENHYENVTWATVRTAATGASRYSEANGVYIQANTGYQVQRWFARFDTSGLGASAEITDVNLHLKGDTSVVGATKAQPTSNASTMKIYEGTQGDTLEPEDYDAFGTTLLGSCAYADFPATDNTDVSIDITTTIVNKTGYTYLCARMSADADNITPGGNNYLVFSSETHTTTNRRPYLEVTYSSSTTYSVTAQAKSRLKKLANEKTVSSKSRIKLVSITKTVSSKSRIAKDNNTVTVGAKANIGNTKTNTVSALSRIKNTINRTIQSKARIEQTSVEKTVSGKSRIITRNITKTVQSKGRIFKENTKTLSAKSNLVNSWTKTISAKATINNAITSLLSARAWIMNNPSSNTKINMKLEKNIKPKLRTK